MWRLSRIFVSRSGLPDYCRALIWIGGLGWGLSLFLICASILRFEYHPLEGIVATPAFLLYPEQKDFWLYILALVIIPLAGVICYVVGELITALSSIKINKLSQSTVSMTFLLGWLTPLSYLSKQSIDWVLLALSLVLFIFINVVVYLQQTIDFTMFALWLFSGAAAGIAFLTNPFLDISLVRQHPLAFLLLFMGLGCLGYFCLNHKRLIQRVSFGLLPLCLIPLHALFWSVAYQGGKEVLRRGDWALILKFDGALIVTSLMIGLASSVFLKEPRDSYRKFLGRCLFYLVIPLLLYILAYSPNIHGPLDLFHEGERLSPAHAIAQGRNICKEVVFIHGFLRDPGVALATFKVFGHSVAGLRVVEHFLFPIVIVLSYYLALICVGSEIAVLYSMLALIGFWPFFYDWRMIPCILVVITVLVFINKQSIALPFLAGVSVGLALITSVDMGIVGLLIGCLFFGLFSISTRRVGFFLYFSLSLGLCLAGLAVWLARTGVLLDCLQWNIQLLRVNSHWNGMPFPYPLDTWARYVKTFLSPAATILSMTYLALKWIRRKWENRCWAVFVLLVANTLLYNRTVVGGQLHSSHIQDGSHFAPLLLMTVFLAEKRRLHRHFLVALLTAVLLVPTPLSNGRTLLSLLEALPQKNRISIPEAWILSENSRIGSIFLPREQYFLVSEMIDFLSSVGSFWDFTDHGLLYFLSDRLSPTRFYTTHHVITVEDQREVIAALEQTQPAFVLYRSGTGWDAIAGIDRTIRNFLVSEYLLENYHFFKKIGGFVVLERGTPHMFPQPLAFRVDLGYMPVLWAQDFLENSSMELMSESILNNWQYNQDMHLIKTAESEWSLITIGSDPQLEKHIILDPQSVKYFLLRMRVRGVGEPKAQIFWRSEGEGFSEERSVLFSLLPDGKEHSYLIRLASLPGWTWSNTVTGLRFDPADRPSVEVSITGWEILSCR